MIRVEGVLLSLRSHRDRSRRQSACARDLMISGSGARGSCHTIEQQPAEEQGKRRSTRPRRRGASGERLRGTRAPWAGSRHDRDLATRLHELPRQSLGRGRCWSAGTRWYRLGTRPIPRGRPASTDAELAESITKGRGRMPAFPLPPQTVEGLVHLVRLFNRDRSSASSGATRRGHCKGRATAVECARAAARLPGFRERSRSPCE